MPTIYNTYIICGFAAVGGGLFGFDISSMSGVLATAAYKNYFGNPTGTTQGAITCSMPAGSLVGALGSSYIADRFSRRRAIQVAAVLWILGSIIQCASQNVGSLCCGRVISGFGVGIASSVVPVYQSEIAPKEIRGRVVALQQWAITWGILIQYFIQYGASFVGGGPSDQSQPTSAFRIPWGIQTFPAAILFFAIFILPPSPRWLASKDRWEEAIQVIANLHGHGDINHPKVLAEYQEIEEALRFEREEAINSYRRMLEPRMLKRIILGMSIQTWSQLCGMNIMMYYIQYIMQASGVGSPLLTASIQYIINVALTLPAIIYIDTWGRRPTLLVGAFLMMVLIATSATIEGVYGQANDATTWNQDNENITWLIYDNPEATSALIATTYLTVATYACTWGPISWAYPAEIFPSKIRAKAVGLTTATNWFWNCVLAFAVPPLLWYISWKMYIIFAVFNGVAFVHVFLTAPETKGKTLEEMDEVFESGRPAWRSPPRGSRLDQLALEIAEGQIKVIQPGGTPLGDMKRASGVVTSISGPMSTHNEDVRAVTHHSFV